MIWLDYLDEISLVRVRRSCLKYNRSVPDRLIWSRTKLAILVLKNNVEAVRYRTNRPLPDTLETRKAIKFSASEKPELRILQMVMNSGRKSASVHSVKVSAFKESILSNQLEKVQFILRFLRHINDSIGQHELCEGLYTASESGCVEIVKYLTNSGVIFDYEPNLTQRCLAWASCNGHLEVVKHFAAMSFPKDQSMISYVNAIEYASDEGHSNVVRYLTLLACVHPRTSRPKLKFEYDPWQTSIKTLVQKMISKDNSNQDSGNGCLLSIFPESKSDRRRGSCNI